MTHEELLAKIQSDYEENKHFRDDPKWKPFAALRAIVELHKPIEEDGKLWCKHEECYSHVEFLERTDCECAYPCATIQAIEKELK